jgi:hypothetical protein
MRAGVAHPAEPTDYALGFFNQDQLAALRGEPMLTVEEADATEAGFVVTGTPASPVVPLGSTLLLFPIGPDETVALSQFIANGLHKSGLTVDAWNALSEADRAGWLQEEVTDVIDRLMSNLGAQFDRQVEELTTRMTADREAAVAEALEKAAAAHEEALGEALQKAEADKTAAIEEALKKAASKKTEAGKNAGSQK